MKIIVGKHDIRLENEPINEKEMNINSCEFEFDEDIVGFNKEAYFTKDNTTYKMIILNDTCEIPNEVLVSEGKVELGVSYFKIENDTTTRYNPSPTYFYVLDGSLKDKTKNGLVIKTPSELEQFENEIEDYIKTLNIDIDVSKEGNTTTVIATNANGEHHSAEIYDGEPGPAGRDGADGYSPSASVSKSGTTTTITITDKNGTTTANVNDGADGRDGQDGYTPVKGVDYFTQEDIASLNIPTDTNDLTNGAGYITKAVNDLTYYYTTSNTYTKTEVDTLIGNINQFKVEIVSVLPIQDIDTHTIYLVAKTGSSGDAYNEYIYINNNWELIGSTEVDLSNYYTKSETNTLLSGKADSSSLSTVATSGSYNDLSNTPTIPTALSDLSDDSTHRLVTDTEKTTWSGKQDALVSGTNIKTINNESVLGSGNITISGGTTYTAGKFLNIDTNNVIDFNVEEKKGSDIGKTINTRLNLDTLKHGITTITNNTASTGSFYYSYNYNNTYKTGEIALTDCGMDNWCIVEIELYHTIDEMDTLSDYQEMGKIYFYSTISANTKNVGVFRLKKNYTGASDIITTVKIISMTDYKGVNDTYEAKSNKVTSISNSSTDTQYPSAKCVYDAIYGALNSNY